MGHAKGSRTVQGKFTLTRKGGEGLADPHRRGAGPEVCAITYIPRNADKVAWSEKKYANAPHSKGSHRPFPCIHHFGKKTEHRRPCVDKGGGGNLLRGRLLCPTGPRSIRGP